MFSFLVFDIELENLPQRKEAQIEIYLPDECYHEHDGVDQLRRMHDGLHAHCS